MTDVNAADTEQSAEAIAGLFGRLQVISPQRAAATARLLAAGDVLVRGEQGIRLELRTGADQHVPYAATTELGHATGKINLVIIEEAGSAAIGDRVWHDFQGEERLLAWALAYETLVAELSTLLGTSLLPIRLGDAPSRPDDIWYWLDWRFEDAASMRCRGLLGLDRTALDALARVSDWRRHDTRETDTSRNIPLPCKVSMQPLTLRGGEMRGLAVGDVILLGPRAAVLASLRLRIDDAAAFADVHGAWAVAVVPGGISLTRALTRAELRSDTMTPETPAPHAEERPAETPSAEASHEDPRESIDVRIEIVLDSFGMTLAEIDRMSAGQVLPLTQTVDHARVALRANGKEFGTGELVSLGDTLGVKLVRIGESRGLQ